MPFSEIDHSLIFFIIFLMGTLLVSRTLSALKVVCAFVCACLFITFDGHYWIASLALPKGQNPQVATVFLMVGCSAAMLLGLTLKRWRSIDRVLVGFAGVSVLATFVLFHYIFVQQVMPAWAKDAAWGNSYLLPTPLPEFKQACVSSKLSCWTGDDIANGDLPNSISQQVNGINDFYLKNRPDGEVGHGFGVFNDLGTDGVSAVLFHRDGDDVRVISDPRSGIRIHSAIRHYFYMLSTAAHSVWVLGALSLLAFHRVRFRRRMSC